MKPERWQEIDELLQSVLAHPFSEQRAFLFEACAGDEFLRLEVESLLESHEEAGDFLEQSLSQTAADLLIVGRTQSVLGQHIGPYLIAASLGAGGMGEVYLADDERLGRKVALKLLPDYFVQDQSRRHRFNQEARSASSLNHPNIVTIYEIGEVDGHHFIATEFIEGETLRQYMIRSRPSVKEVVDIGFQLASALTAAHRLGIIHRDIKPENIMIRPDGYVKVLDFGLAKLTEHPFGLTKTGPSPGTIMAIDSIPGVVLGTVTYMSPEQARGLSVDARTDVWSLGVVLYEMLSTTVPFGGETAADVIVSILEKEPAHFTRDAGVPMTLQRIIDKTLRKDRETRYQTVHELALDLKTLKEELNVEARLDSPAPEAVVDADPRSDATLGINYDSSARAISARTIRRITVLPFRMLRPDVDLDYLAFSVPDAVAAALSVLNSVVVRAPTGPGQAIRDLDLKQIAEESQAEAVLTGAVLRAGNGIRVSCRLLEVPNGTLLWSHDPQVDMSNLFELQDNLVRGIVDSLSLELSAREHGRLKRDVPSNAIAYEFYLRGNELSRRGLAGFNDLTVARDLYLRSVAGDSAYAPAWAQLGRCYRLIGKGMENGQVNSNLAETALRRALDLNPDLPIANSQYAFLESEVGRAQDAVGRLLRCIRTGSSSPDLFTALVLCCRYCGLLEASVAAHEFGRRLDPLIATSVSHTHYQLGDYDSALRNVAVGAWAIKGMALGTMGRIPDGVAAFREVEASGIPPPMRAFIVAWRGMLEGNYKQSLEAAERCIQEYLDPEGVFYMGLIMAHVGEHDRSLTVLNECMDRGFSSFNVLRLNPWFESLHSRPQFTELLNRAEARLIEANHIYRNSGGPAVLGKLSLTTPALG